jgi:hypothetical protein
MHSAAVAPCGLSEGALEHAEKIFRFIITANLHDTKRKYIF